MKTIDFVYQLEGLLYDVTFTYYSGSNGTMYARNGDPGDPPEDPEVEVLSILDSEGNDIFSKLTVQEAEDLLDACHKYGADYKEEPKDEY